MKLQTGRRILIPAALLSALLLLRLGGSVTPPAREEVAAPLVPPDSEESCRVRRVIDGDTLRVLCRGTDTTIRLLRINTPERGQPGYETARRALRALIGGRRVRLEDEQPGSSRFDAFDRRLCYVFAGAVHINVEMVRQGWSRYWTKYGSGRFAADFLAAERHARRENSGLWRWKTHR